MKRKIYTSVPTVPLLSLWKGRTRGTVQDAWDGVGHMGHPLYCSDERIKSGLWSIRGLQPLVRVVPSVPWCPTCPDVPNVPSVPGHENGTPMKKRKDYPKNGIKK